MCACLLTGRGAVPGLFFFDFQEAMIRPITLRACSVALCLFVATLLPAAAEEHQGGKLRLLSASASGTLDSAGQLHAEIRATVRQRV